MLKFNLLISIVITVLTFMKLIISVHGDTIILDKSVVKTSTGLIRGRLITFENIEVLVLSGIPYAKPPVGLLRFRKPIPIDGWTGILNATTLPPTCYQESYSYFPGFKGEEMWNPNTNVSEDCLYLNLWIPMKPGSTSTLADNLSPMLIWIYGGGFMTGTSTLDVYNAAVLAAKGNVIIASMQYRIGVFGFLYLSPLLSRYEQDEVPGNAGLWDQYLAIKWLKQNAVQFGANPKSITLFGESAGAVSANIHLLSPISKGLTNRIVLQSGSLNVPWSHMSGRRATEIALEFIDRCGCNSTLLKKSSKRVLACIRGVAPKILSLRQWQSYSGFMGFPSMPTIDGIYMPSDPVTMLKNYNFTNVSILMGSNKDEGTYHMFYDYMKYFKRDGPTALSREQFLEIIDKIFQNASLAEREAIIFQYTNWENFTDNWQNQRKLGEAVSQRFFLCPTNDYAQQLAEHGANVYYYYFTQRSSNALWGEWMGVLHGDEIEYFFGKPMNTSLNYRESDRELSARMVYILSEFARNGIPTIPSASLSSSSSSSSSSNAPEQVKFIWPKYTANDQMYYELNSRQRNYTGKGPFPKACTFWNKYLPTLRQYIEEKNLLCHRKTSSSNASSASSAVAVITKSSIKIISCLTSFPSISQFNLLLSILHREFLIIILILIKYFIQIVR